MAKKEDKIEAGKESKQNSSDLMKEKIKFVVQQE